MKNIKILIISFVAMGSALLALSPLPDSTYAEDTNSLVSGEVVLDAAPETNTMSGEIDIVIPFNPEEVDQPVYWLPDEPKNVNLNSATQVSSGPLLNIFIALVLSVLISTYMYKKKISL